MNTSAQEHAGIAKPGVAEPGVATPEDQRREPRHPAHGVVKVKSSGSKIDGDLVDVSENGFRMAHLDALALEPGQVIEFWHAYAAGTGRVIWNRILQGRVETGFFIIERF